MPFTISHIAAVLPGHQPLRRWGLLSAAIIGSMVPDFGFLMPIHLMREQTHGALALLTFCLPMGLVAWWSFQLLIKPAWFAVLPGRWRRRLRAEHPVARIGQWRVWLAASAAILFGALTHLIWDGFTHEGGHGVRLLPFLDAYYGPEAGGYELPLYRWLQHGSSVVGLVIVVAAAWRWTRGTAPVPGETQTLELSAGERHAWLTAYMALPTFMLALAFGWWYHRLRLHVSIASEATRLAFAGLGGACLSLLLVSAAIRLRLHARAPGSTPR